MRNDIYSGSNSVELDFSDLAYQDLELPDLENSTRESEGGTVGSVLRFAAVGVQAAISAAWSGYTSAWLLYAFWGVCIGLISNLVFKVPMWQIVDVCLSIFLGLVAFKILDHVSALINEIEEWGMLAVAYQVTVCILYLLLPFALVLGFTIYGWAVGDYVAGKSYIFNGYLGIFVQGYEGLAGWTGDFLNVISKTKGPTGAEIETVNIDLVTKYLFALSLGVSILVEMRKLTAKP